MDIYSNIIGVVNHMIKLFFLWLLISCNPAFATYQPQTFLQGATDNTLIGNIGDALKVNVTNAASSTVTQGPGGASSWLVNLGQVGGASITLGQKTMANSIPIAIASDQSALPVTGTFFQATQPVSTTQLPAALDGSGFLKVHEQGTAAISAASLPLPTNAAIETGGHLASIDTKLTSPITVTGPLTDTQLRASAVPVSLTSTTITGTVTSNIGTTGGLALDATLTGGTQTTRITDGTNTATVKAASTAALTTDKALVVAVSPNNSVAVTGTFFQATQPVSGTFFQATQPISAASLPLPALAATSTKQSDGTQKTQVVDGTGAVWGPIVTISGINYQPVVLAASGTTGSAVPARTIQVGGSDGTNLRTFSTDTSGVQNENSRMQDGAGTAITSTLVAGKQRLDVTLASAGVDGSPAPSLSNLSGGIDGSSNQQALSVDTSGRLNTNTFDGAGTAVTSTTQNSKTGLSTSISGQDPLTGSGTGNALNTTPVPDTVVTQYHCASIQHSLTGTNTITFEGSNDGSIFTSIACQNNAVFTTGVLTTTAAGLFYCPLTGFQHFRTRVSAFTSGTATDVYAFTPMPCDSMQKTTAINGTVTVTGTVNTNPAIPTFGSQVASAARTTTGNSGSLTQAAPNSNAVFEVNVTAVSGTTPKLILFFEESYDNGTTFTPEYYWEPITIAGQYTIPNILISTSRFRFSWVISGTTPSFTFSIGSTQGSSQGQWLRRFIDTSLDLNTTNAVGAAFNGDGCKTYNFTANISACTLFPTIALQLSEDGTNYATPLSLPITANGTFMSSVQTGGSKFVRMTTTTGGTTCALGYISIRCTQY